jgi:tetratricopeptide (TPR) repeat protein
MKNSLVKPILAAAAGALLLFSCALPPPVSRPDLGYARGRLAAEDFAAALDSYAAAAESYPGDRGVLREFRVAAEKIKKRADDRFAGRDFESAEKVYSLLIENFPGFAEFERALSFGPESLSGRVLECQVRLSERRARQSLAEGDYLRAFDGFKVLPPEVLRDPAQSAGLRRIMEETRRLADKALARKDFVAAGKGYAALSREYPLARQAGLSLTFSLNDAQEGLKSCRAQLTREGLDQYRKGNLAEAIAIWQGLLQFDPENVEILKAMDTATEQLKKLQKKQG